MPNEIRYAESFLALPGRLASLMNGKVVKGPFNLARADTEMAIKNDDNCKYLL